MYHLVGSRSIIETILLLRTSVGLKNTDIKNANDLKKSYLQLLEALQPHAPINKDTKLQHLYKGPIANELIQIFKTDNPYNDTKHHIDNVDTDISDNLIEEKLFLFLEAHPELYNLFSLVMHTLLLAPCKTAYGGTSSRAIGTLWMEMQDLESNELLEFFCHELTHTVMFIDEWRYTHYNDVHAIAEKENYSPSAILAKMRPLDKVIHSIVVATEVILLRNESLGHPANSNRFHPKTNQLAKQTLASIAYIQDTKKIRDLLSNRSLELAALCESKVAQFA
jgi:hypothetical protein